MTMKFDADEIALEVLNALDTGEQIPTFSSRIEGLAMADAYRVTAAMRGQRTARGEVHAGRKIGFTNRTIWPIYKVDAPIWGDMWDRTVFNLAETPDFALDGLLEPRIEPEIVFGIARTPEPGMDDAALLGCCEWVAHGFEVVQSPYAGWQFQAADTVCGAGLHGALLVGERRTASPDLLAELRDFHCTLILDGEEVETGHSANVLDGPLKALGHYVDLLATDPHNPPLARGEMVTTGTLTDAKPVTAGQRWSTRLDGLGLAPVAVSFV